MLLHDLVRFSSQHRTLYCYGILSIWIFMLIAGMYKYMANSDPEKGVFDLGYERDALMVPIDPSEQQQDIGNALERQPYSSDCNPIESILRHDDGGLFDGWQLQGVLLLTRHGDRGPMAHVRGINAVDCGGDLNAPAINRYRTFLANSSTGVTTSAGVGHATWARMGPFHGSPLLPAFPKSCLLGQLTYKGIGQLLHIGDIMRQSYGNLLGLLTKLPAAALQKPTNTSMPQPVYVSEDIVVYSTRYRRTFQSAMALMFAFLPPERWLALTIREAHSVAFCFTDCACPQATYLKNELQKEAQQLLLKNHASVAIKIKMVGLALLQYPSMPLHPMEVRDAVLSMMCHNAELPCKRPGETDVMAGVVEQPASSTLASDANDFINIDQDQDFLMGAGKDAIDVFKKSSDFLPESSAEQDTEITSGNGCIEPSHVSAVMSYTLWQGKRDFRHPFTRQQGVLRAYGLLRNIVGNILKMVSGHHTKFVLYSGHDHTLQFLLAALGVASADVGPFIPFAARLAIEVYRSDKNDENYFRVVYNGRDVTQQLDVCEGGKSLRVNRDSRGNKADLCPIENIIRLIHDDYFGGLNATNFREACQLVKKAEL